jgi:HlyD family secretion protein
MKKKIFIGLVLLAFLAVGIFLRGDKALEYEGYDVMKGTVSDYFEEDGTIKYKKDSNIVSRVSGLVTSVYFAEGDTVTEGSVLMDIDSSDIELKIKGLEEKIKALGYQYKDALNPVDKAEIENLEELLKQAQNTFADAQKDYDRNKNLFERGAVSSVELENSKSSYDNAQSQVNIANSQLKLGRVRISRYKEKELLSNIDAMEFELENLKLTRDYHKVKAPFTGVLVEKKSDANDFVNIGQTVFEMVDKNEIVIESEILSKYYEDIEIGTDVELEINEHIINGHVSKIYPKANEKVSDLGISQKRILVEIEANEKVDEFIINQEIDIKFFTIRENDVLRVAKSAVFDINGQDYVFLVKDGVSTLKTISLGTEGNKYYTVLEGLSESDKIIRYPDKELEENIKIELIYTEDLDEY